MVGFEKRLKTLRLNADMKQNELAVKLGMTKSVISAYENGSRKPSYDVLIQISQIFKVSTDYLLGVEQRETPGLEQREKLDLSGLTQNEINALRMLIRAMKER